MQIIIQALLNGILMGAIYGVIALGLSLIFGVMKIINFAHGAFIMIAMFMAFWLWKLVGLEPNLSIFIIAPALFFIGYLTQKYLISGLFKAETAREPIGVLIFTMGLWIFLDNVILMIFGPDFKTITSNYAKSTISIKGDLILPFPLLYAFVISVLSIGIFYLFLKKTTLGKAIRATGQDREAASSLGIDSYRIYNISFGLGLTVVGIGGGLMCPLYYVYPFVGDIFALRSFVIVVLAGIGSIGGALWGGIIVGIIETVGAQYITATYTEVLIFGIFLLIIFIRPSGLFGIENE